MPSVTEVLKVVEKRYLEAWRSRVGREESDRVNRDATRFGTAVHAMANKVIWEHKTGVVEIPPELKPFAAAVRGFMARHVYAPIKTEFELVSRKERVGGTLDLYCQLRDGSYAVVDWKTSKQLSREHGLQTALYALLLREAGYKVNRRLVVKISKSKPGTFYARSYLDHEGDVKAARAAVELWHWQYGSKLAEKKSA